MKEWSAGVMGCNKVQRLDGIFQSMPIEKKGEMKNEQKRGIRSRYIFDNFIFKEAIKNV